MDRDIFNYYLNISYYDLCLYFHLSGCTNCKTAYCVALDEKCPKCGGYAVEKEKENRKIMTEMLKYWPQDLFFVTKDKISKTNPALGKKQISRIDNFFKQDKKTENLFERLSLYGQAKREFFRQAYYYVKGELGFNNFVYQVRLTKVESLKNGIDTKIDQIETTKYLEFIYKNFGIYTKICKELEKTLNKLKYKSLAKDIISLCKPTIKPMFVKEIKARNGQTRKNLSFISRLIKENGLKPRPEIKGLIKMLKQHVKFLDRQIKSEKVKFLGEGVKNLVQRKLEGKN